MNASACGSVRTSESICVKTRSMTAPFDWSQCLFCKQKSYKKDRNLKRVESKDRVKTYSMLRITSPIWIWLV